MACAGLETRGLRLKVVPVAAAAAVHKLLAGLAGPVVEEAREPGLAIATHRGQVAEICRAKGWGAVRGKGGGSNCLCPLRPQAPGRCSQRGLQSGAGVEGSRAVLLHTPLVPSPGIRPILPPTAPLPSSSTPGLLPRVRAGPTRELRAQARAGCNARLCLLAQRCDVLGSQGPCPLLG